MIKENFNIFYTDDDKDDRDTFIDAVNEISKSWKILTQSDGDELINLLKSPPPFATIIFLDLNMPRKNGYEVLKEIRQTDDFKDIPIVILSTSNDENTIAKTRLLGASLYISKPWSFNSLKDVIQYAISINWETFGTSGDDFVYKAN